jgi:O-antigen/teichoic acid export membrane protein
MASQKLDTLLVGALASPAIVSFYKLGLQFGKAPALLTDALHVALFPTFARDFARGRLREIRDTARAASVLMAAIMVPVLLAGGLFGDELIAALAGEAFRDAGTPMFLCLIGITPFVVFFWVPPLLLTTGHSGVLLRTVIAGTVLQLVALVALVPGLDASGAALAFALGNFLGVGLGVGFVLREGLLRASGAAPQPAASVSQSASS